MQTVVSNPHSANAAGYMSVPEAAASLGVSGDHVLRLLYAGTITAVNVASDTASRARWRISRESFEQFLAERSNTSGPEAATTCL